MSLLILIGRGLDLKYERRKARFQGQLFLCSFQGADAEASDNRRVSGGYGERVPPVPIPNTEVKPLSADGTWLATARESRTPPDPFSKEQDPFDPCSLHYSSVAQWQSIRLLTEGL